VTESSKGGFYGRSAFRVGEPLPGVLFLKDLGDILDVGLARAYQLEHAGELVAFEMKPPVGGRRRYSGKKVQQWLDGDGEAPRFFGSARRRA
jgi:hypothetical protein